MICLEAFSPAEIRKNPGHIDYTVQLQTVLFVTCIVVVVLQYVPANAGVPGAYMPQYAAMQPVPVSRTQYPSMH